MSAKRPRIGVTPYARNGDPCRQYVPIGYLDGIERAGGEAVVIPYETDPASLRALARSLGGLILSGGPDVEPARYGAAREADCGPSLPERDELEFRLLDAAAAIKLRTLGICRGLQLINAYMGGTLTQHIEGHRQPDSATHWHGVSINPESALLRVAGRAEFAINSSHHQCVSIPAPNAAVCARAPDGVIEGIEFPSEPWIAAAQWHPEKTLDEDDVSMRFFRWIVSGSP